MASAYYEYVGGIPGVNISDGPGGAAAPGLKSPALVENIPGSRGVGCRSFGRPRCLLKKSGGSLASGHKGGQPLTETKGALTSVADICSVPTLVDIYCGAGEESCGSGKGLLARDQRLLQIFGQVTCQFGVFGSVLMPVEDIDAPDRSPGVGMPCGRLGVCR